MDAAVTLKARCLAAAKADAIPEGKSGLWYVQKVPLARDTMVPHSTDEPKRYEKLPAGNYTQLRRLTWAEVHIGGECVMLDTPGELGKHLDFMLRARGRVLITGLGLGCVARGTLANPAVTSVTIIERDPHVLHLVRPHMPIDSRLEIIQADALTWTKNTTETFDCAWHDLWTSADDGEPELQLWHCELIKAMSDRVAFQGAWQFPRWIRRRFRDRGII